MTPLPVASVGGVKVHIGEGDEAQLRAFLERHLDNHFPGMPEHDVTVQLNELPADLPFDAAILADFELIGSFIQQGEHNQIQIYLSTKQPADSVIQTLRAQLEAAGFTEPPNNFMRMAARNAFSELDPTRNMLCSPNKDFSVNFNAAANQVGRTDLSITISESSPFSGPCAEMGPMGRPDFPDILPQLAAPPNTAVRSRGSNFKNNEMSSDAQLTSPLGISELVQYYAEQFEALGWQQTGTSQTEELAWSGWHFQDQQKKPWNGTVTLLCKAGVADLYVITLKVERAKI